MLLMYSTHDQWFWTCTVQCSYVNVVMSKGDQMQRDRDVSLGMHEAYHHNDMQVIMSLTWMSSINWGTFSHRLFLQAPSKLHSMLLTEACKSATPIVSR